MNKFLSISLAALLASSLIANGQEIGTELCSCSPNSYEFKLDFGLTCPPVNITIGNAVQATSCLVSPFGNPNVDNLVPVSVENIDILEMGQNLRVVAQTNVKGELIDGDSFTYTSITADPDSITTTEDVPRALQLNMVGINSEGEKILNVFIITFTNGCGSYPVFQEGQSAGWTQFAGLGPASPELCAVAPPLPDPTLVPTLALSSSPTDSPTMKLVPTDAPVERLPAAPTDAPVERLPAAPTDYPMMRLTPTDAPNNPMDTTDAPPDTPNKAEDADTDSLTDAPVELPEDMDGPTAKFTFSMSMSMRMNDMGDMLDELADASQEFGVWKPLRKVKGGKKDDSNKLMKDSKERKVGSSKKAAKTLKGLKGKGDDKSSKMEKALKGGNKTEKTDSKQTKKDFDGVKIVNKLRRGSSDRRY